MVQMMFNYKSFKKLKTAQVTPDELISENFPKKESIPFLEDFDNDINSLRKIATEILEIESQETPSEQVIQKVFEKLLQRTSSIFIPELEKLMSMKSRSPKIIPQLLKYQKPEEIARIRTFINKEIFESSLEIKSLFNEILELSKSFNPSFTLELLCFMVQNRVNVIYQNEDIKSLLSDEQIETIFDRIKKLKAYVNMMPAKDRDWNQILAGVYELREKRPISEEEKAQWLELVPENMRIVWNLETILRSFNFPFSDVPERIRAEGKKVSESTSIRYFFYPEKDENGRDLIDPVEKRRYALRKLKECIENGFDEDNGKLLELLKLRTSKSKGRRGRPSKEDLLRRELNQEVEQEEQKEPAEIKINDDIAKKIIHYFYYLVSDKSIEGTLDVDTRLRAFKADLIEAGLSYVAEILDKAYTTPKDERYAEFDLKFLSEEEKNICTVLREDFNLDPIPFPVKIPCPLDNPTTTDRFEVDFLLPADVLVGWIAEESTEFDPETNQNVTKTIWKPDVRSQVIFVGEYFGIRYTFPGRKLDENKIWVRPDGSLPVYVRNKYIPKKDPITGEIIKDPNTDRAITEKVTVINKVIPGGEYTEGNFYELKSEWKVFTIQTISDLLGTGTLYFDENDLNTPWKNISPKLDNLNIIYKSKYCDYNENNCKAYKEIMEQATQTPEISIYTDDNAVRERFDNIAQRQSRLIDCAIASIKLSEALMRSKKEFISSPESLSFERKAMLQHRIHFDQLKKKRDNALLEYGRTKSERSHQKFMSLDRQVENFEGSDLRAFREKLMSILQEESFSKRIEELENLKQRILSNEESYTFAELKTVITNISSDLITQTEERGLEKE